VEQVAARRNGERFDHLTEENHAYDNIRGCGPETNNAGPLYFARIAAQIAVQVTPAIALPNRNTQEPPRALSSHS